MNLGTLLKTKPVLTWLVAGTGAGIALYVASWMAAANLLEKQAARWIAAQEKNNVHVAHDAPRRSGFPGRVDIAYPNWTVGSADAPFAWSWRAKEIRLWAEPWLPLRFTVDLAGEHKISGAWTPLGVEATVSMTQGDIRPVLTADGRLAEMSLALKNLSVTAGANAQELAAAEAADLSMVSVPDASSPTWRLQIDAANWRAPPLEQVPAFQASVRNLHVLADLVGELQPGPLPTALQAWQEGGGTLELREFALDWPPLSVNANGTWALSPELQPVGAMTATFKGFFAGMDALSAEGRINGDDARAAKVVLALLARTPPGGDEPELKISVTIQDGKLYAGPLALMDVPPVAWPTTKLVP